MHRSRATSGSRRCRNARSRFAKCDVRNHVAYRLLQALDARRVAQSSPQDPCDSPPSLISPVVSKRPMEPGFAHFPMSLLSDHRNSDARRVFENRSGRERKMAGEGGQHLWHQLATASDANRERSVTGSAFDARCFCVPSRSAWHEVGEGGGERKPAGESARKSPRNTRRAAYAPAWIGTPGGIRTHDLLLRSSKTRGPRSGVERR